MGLVHIGERPRLQVSALGLGIRRTDARSTKTHLDELANSAGELFVTRYASGKKVHSNKQSLAGKELE
jgi:hypothetical protein